MKTHRHLFAVSYLLAMPMAPSCADSDPCDQITCGTGEVCQNGACVNPNNQCSGIECPLGLVCGGPNMCVDPYPECNNSPAVSCTSAAPDNLQRQFFYRQENCLGCPFFGTWDPPTGDPTLPSPSYDNDSHLDGASSSVGPDGSTWVPGDTIITAYFPYVSRYDATAQRWICERRNPNRADRSRGTIAINTRQCAIRQ